MHLRCVRNIAYSFSIVLGIVLFLVSVCTPRIVNAARPKEKKRELGMRFTSRGIVADSAARVELGPNIYFVDATGLYRRFGQTLWLEVGTHLVSVQFFKSESSISALKSEMALTVQVDAEQGHVYRIEAAVDEIVTSGGPKRGWTPIVVDVTEEFRKHHWYFYVLDRRRLGDTVEIVNVGKGAKIRIFSMKGNIANEWVTADTSCEWTGNDKRNRPVKPGLYLYRLSRADGSKEEGTIVVQDEGHVLVPDTTEIEQ